MRDNEEPAHYQRLSAGSERERAISFREGESGMDFGNGEPYQYNVAARKPSLPAPLYDFNETGESRLQRCHETIDS